MSRLKEMVKVHLIHKLGGVTEQEMMIRCRPMKVEIAPGKIQTLRVRNVVNRERVKIYPGYLDMVKSQMAQEILKKMIDCGALVYHSEQPSGDAWAMETTAMARVISCGDGEWM